MGLDQTIHFEASSTPPWPAIRDVLLQSGLAVQLRMIDGELSFPDEEPPNTWRELRLGTPQGMLTLRREGARLICVIWGNADVGLRQAWNAVVWACAHAGAGRIDDRTAEDFRRTADLPPNFLPPSP